MSNIEIIKCRNKKSCEHLLGKFIDDTHYSRLIENDCDLYDITGDITEECSERNIIFKFRKNVFSEEEQLGCYEGLYDSTLAASNNRGMASGPRSDSQGARHWATDHQQLILKQLQQQGFGFNPKEIIYQPDSKDGICSRGLVWVKSKILEKHYVTDYATAWEEVCAHFLTISDPEELAKEAASIQECISTTSYANAVNSSVVGFFDRYPRYPYARACRYNEDNPEKFVHAFPYLKKLNQMFSELLPYRYAKQKASAKLIDENYLVAKETVFTTITTNRNFRTAAHRDAGDLNEGFSNLSVVAKAKDWKGGYLVLPEFDVAINIRPGDVLFINNHEGIHGNTEIQPIDGGSLDDMERISIVCYFREKMVGTGEFAYENIRKDFTESRRLNTNHEFWVPLWNGVSPNMFESDEWKEFLLSQADGERMLRKYHPNLVVQDSLDELFV